MRQCLGWHTGYDKEKALLLNFEKTVEAFADALIQQKEPLPQSSATSITAVSTFLLAVYSRMPDYTRLPCRVLTLLFDAWPLLTHGKPFHQLDRSRRVAQIQSWERSRMEFRRRLIEFYGTLAYFGLYSELYGEDYEYE